MPKHLVDTVLARSAELKQKENDIKTILGLIFRSLQRECADDNKSVERRHYEELFVRQTPEYFFIFVSISYQWVFANFEKEKPQEIRFRFNTGLTAMRFDNTEIFVISDQYIEVVHRKLQDLLDGVFEKFPFMERQMSPFLKVTKYS